ncbi:peptide chain release factor N(5)-glutamine methyltransferase [Marinomonas epiphytica]
MARIDSVLKQATERLQQGSETALLDAQLILSHVLKVTTSYLFTWPEREVNDSDVEQFERLLVRRIDGEPVAYLLGEQAFWTLDLDVAPCTLIPRPDTERLVEVALECIDQTQVNRILDLGTGTGAIALALAKEVPNASVVGVDLVPEAVALAQSNALKNQLSVNFHQSCWFDRLPPEEAFDLIVSNPPYIDPDDEHLHQGDVRFEPKSALVSAEHGLQDIRLIIEQAPRYLAPNARLVFEHGYDQAESVRDLFKRYGYHGVESFQDYAGKDRVTLGIKPS